MSNTLTRSADSGPAASLMAVTQAALGCGLGLLLAGKLRSPARQVAALAMLSVGVISTVPLLLEAVSHCWNHSERGMRRRLETIRHDSGFSDDAEMF